MWRREGRGDSTDILSALFYRGVRRQLGNAPGSDPRPLPSPHFPVIHEGVVVVGCWKPWGFGSAVTDWQCVLSTGAVVMGVAVSQEAGGSAL